MASPSDFLACRLLGRRAPDAWKCLQDKKEVEPQRPEQAGVQRNTRHDDPLQSDNHGPPVSPKLAPANPGEGGAILRYNQRGTRGRWIAGGTIGCRDRQASQAWLARCSKSVSVTPKVLLTGPLTRWVVSITTFCTLGRTSSAQMPGFTGRASY